MAGKYKEYKKLDMPEVERQVSANWEAQSIFQKSVSQRAGAKPFVFYDGPPSANGMPGIHHVISRTIKDLFCRFQTMNGRQVHRKAGWDTHGLPVELGVEKELGITKEDIGYKISVEDYNKKCREVVMRYKDKWDDLTRKMGYWVDLNNPYITFDNDYIESLWWALSTLFKKGYLYKSVSIQPYSPAAGTGLSSHELNQPGTYKSVKDTTVVAMFEAVTKGSVIEQWTKDTVHFLAWTTTPWTLPSNLGLTVGPKIDYVLVETLNPYLRTPIKVILAKALLPKYFKAEAENIGLDVEDAKILPWRILGECKGEDLIGMRYKQLLPFDANSAQHIPGDPFRVIGGDFVTTEDGTGIVHTAPAHGADDYKVGQKAGIGIINLIDREGKFVEGTGFLSGRFIKNYKDQSDFADVDVDIAVHLKQNGQAFKVEKYEHSYPHCWRTDKPIVYYPLDAWFIRTTAARERMIELNKTINWKPKATGEGRFGNWLENMVDWNLSRSRFWGTPLPVWSTNDGSERVCIGSVKELTEAYLKAKDAGYNQDSPFEIGEDGLLKIDLHKPYVDKITLVSASGQPMQREADLIDVWFDSGAMPFAQIHYPFENQAGIDQQTTFPADFIAEGVDQTRGWFYTLHAINVLLFDSVAYKTVVSNGLVLDKNGNKMSKRLGNVIDPFDTINQYSADATRWYLVTNASPWDSMRFDINGIVEVQRKFFGTIFNTYQFFALYANVDGFVYKEADIPYADRPEMDRWILSSLHSLIGKVKAAYEDYEPTVAGRAIESFVSNELSNWYVRLCRRRFWKGEYEHDKISAYQTLYTCLVNIAKLMAPISPFFADWLFINLNNVAALDTSESVHLALFPEANPDIHDATLERQMQLAQDVTSLILSLRKKVNIKVRQPLQKIIIPKTVAAYEQDINAMAELILSEVNVKDIVFVDEGALDIKKKLKPNFKKLGAQLGGAMKAVAAHLTQMSTSEINQLEKEGSVVLVVDGTEHKIALEDVEVLTEDIPGLSLATKDRLSVALDTNITEQLLLEGHARELVNRIQKIRKDLDLKLTDRIDVLIEEKGFSEINKAIKEYNDYISSEILANSIQFVNQLSEGIEIDINVHLFKINISKL